VGHELHHASAGERPSLSRQRRKGREVQWHASTECTTTGSSPSSWDGKSREGWCRSRHTHKCGPHCRGVHPRAVTAQWPGTQSCLQHALHAGGEIYPPTAHPCFRFTACHCRRISSRHATLWRVFGIIIALFLPLCARGEPPGWDAEGAALPSPALLVVQNVLQIVLSFSCCGAPTSPMFVTIVVRNRSHQPHFAWPRSLSSVSGVACPCPCL
jgi:hypothetical protein